MKRSILIVGATGVGKSTLSKKLRDLGYESYSIEDIEGIFKMYRKGTREIFEDYDIKDVEKVRNGEWLCDIAALQELINNQKTDLAFYCGIGSNTQQMIPLFGKVILLKVTNEKLRSRLSNREGVEGKMGNTAETRDEVFGWKDWWENEMQKKGAIAIDAYGPVEEITGKVLEVTKE
ncbi:MAG: AAA family ATPase [Candidatus Wildermuthbacteria bacterium]|nr:AAA family ATPase [Candidatus Wildermuthbacteria bacterium]